MRRHTTTLLASFCAVALSCSLAGCGTSVNVSAPGQAEGPIMSIGVPIDEPGIAWYHDGEYSGLAVDVATYVAKVLGYGSKQLYFHAQTADTRVQQVEQGTVDFTMINYSYDGGKDATAMKHTRSVDGTTLEVSEPYLVARNQLLVRADDAGKLTDLNDLDGKTVCTVQGDYAGEQLHADHPNIAMERRADFGQCTSSLMVGQSDAIAASRPVLAGLRKTGGEQYLHLQGKTYGTQAFGIAVKAGQSELVNLIDTALQQMVDDGSWDKMVDDMERDLGVDVSLQLNPVRVAKSHDVA